LRLEIEGNYRRKEQVIGDIYYIEFDKRLTSEFFDLQQTIYSLCDNYFVKKPYFYRVTKLSKRTDKKAHHMVHYPDSCFNCYEEIVL